MPVQVSNLTSSRLGLSRLFAAAVVSPQFRNELLSQPESAIANGYLGQAFALSAEEQSLVVSIQADSLSDLARKVNRALR
jgi:hypothetical protein